MALINCPECGRQISDKAVACPGCGYPISSGAASSTTPAQSSVVQVNFKRGGILYPQVSGTVFVDGRRVGSAGKGASFTVQLAEGHHDIVVESVENAGFRKRENSESFSLDIPKGTKQMTVHLVVREGLMNFLSGSGKRVVVESVE